MESVQREAQPAAGSGQVLGEAGRWTAASLERLRGIDMEEVEFHRGPIGFSILWRGRPIGRINVYAHLENCTAKLDGHEFWVAANKVIPRWHYNPGFAVPDIRAAKSVVRATVADAKRLHLLTETTSERAAPPPSAGPRF
ncbi:hypothetical protein OIU34_20625 [Pararhizobium sp. BT-229]|uniref:hypothetical protein n=1 Tax=Pararhizobium sp. BT-229 TaxID=2986923 RepID=UPI0021F6B953|nr:hypothetical protein [Pararhizobium sp. BT-229]MCV9964295.1 hypothetical protein [Pararhizobium sp. BT-229]